jgi:hypothetical protein
VTVQPGGSSDLAASASQALSCPTGSIAWSVQEGAVGGSVTAAGVYTAPACSASFVPGTYHVVATGCGKSVTVNVAATDTVDSVIIACALVSGNTTCEPDPGSISVPAGSTVQFYAKVTFYCGEYFYSPPLPSPPPGGVL